MDELFRFCCRNPLNQGIFLVFGGASWYNTPIFWGILTGDIMLHYLRELFYALDFASMSAAVLRVAAIILCMTVHETCHGLAAYALGDPTAKVDAPSVPESPAPHRLAGPCPDVCGGIRLGKSPFRWTPVLPKTQAGHGPHRPGRPVSTSCWPFWRCWPCKAISLVPYCGDGRGFSFCLYTLAPFCPSVWGCST